MNQLISTSLFALFMIPIIVESQRKTWGEKKNVRLRLTRRVNFLNEFVIFQYFKGIFKSSFFFTLKCTKINQHGQKNWPIWIKYSTFDGKFVKDWNLSPICGSLLFFTSLMKIKNCTRYNFDVPHEVLESNTVITLSRKYHFRFGLKLWDSVALRRSIESLINFRNSAASQTIWRVSFENFPRHVSSTYINSQCRAIAFNASTIHSRSFMLRRW